MISTRGAETKSDGKAVRDPGSDTGDVKEKTTNKKRADTTDKKTTKKHDA